MIRFTFTITILFFVLYSLEGQLSEGGLPPSFEILTLKSSDKLNSFELPRLRIEKLLRKDSNVSGRLPYSEYRKVKVDIKKEGTLTEIDNGSIWRYNIISENALSIGLIFNHYHLPPDAKLFVYSKNREIIYGVFTSNNNKLSKILAISDLSAKDIIIEYFEPFTAEFSGEVFLEKIGQAYRDIDGFFTKADDDYVDINCPLGDDFQLEKHAVARMSWEENGFGYLCTGALINNTKNDGTPYFLTARHCISSQTAASSLITRFNYEKSDCNSGLAPNLTLSGSSLKADYEPSDMTLLLLDETPPSNYQPYYAGWNALSDSILGWGSVIHHPAGDLKKVSIDYNQIISFPFSAEWDNESTSPEDSHWLVFLDEGLTEGGSSGCPLFDENNRIAGQLHGGGETHDFFGKLSWSWEGGIFSFQKLRFWLDPDDTGALIYDGYSPSGNKVEAIPMTDFQDVCIGEPVQLEDGSLFSPTLWNWSFLPATVDFTGGTDASSENPVVSFLENSTYSVILSTNNSVSSDSRTRASYIRANSELKPEITNYSGDKLTYCLFDSATFYASGAETYNWTVESGIEFISIDSSKLSEDNFVFYRNDTLDVDSNFTVVLSLTGSHGICSETVYDTLTVFYPFNDNIEDAVSLRLGLNGPFHNYCATVQAFESNPPEGSCNSQETWYGCEVSDTILDNSVWFTFPGPESGILSIDAPGFDNQIAIYEANTATDIISGDDSRYTIIAANDDFFGPDKDYSALIQGAGVEPGKTY